jgi:hypothetical protein
LGLDDGARTHKPEPQIRLHTFLGKPEATCVDTVWFDDYVLGITATR